MALAATTLYPAVVAVEVQCLLLLALCMVLAMSMPTVEVQPLTTEEVAAVLVDVCVSMPTLQALTLPAVVCLWAEDLA